MSHDNAAAVSPASRRPTRRVPLLVALILLVATAAVAMPRLIGEEAGSRTVNFRDDRDDRRNQDEDEDEDSPDRADESSAASVVRTCELIARYNEGDGFVAPASDDPQALHDAMRDYVSRPEIAALLAELGDIAPNEIRADVDVMLGTVRDLLRGDYRFDDADVVASNDRIKEFTQFACASEDQAEGHTTIDPDELARSELKNMAIAQESYFTEHNAYTTDLSALEGEGWTPSDQVESAIRSADAAHYCLEATAHETGVTWYLHSDEGRLQAGVCADV